MAAYAALVSLLQLLETILAARGRRVYHNRAQLKSLREMVSFLLDSLEDSSTDYGKIRDSDLESVESEINDAAHRARDVIESDISNQLLAESDSVVTIINGLVLLFFIVALIYLDLQEEIHLMIQLYSPVMHPFYIALQSLLPLSFQQVLFDITGILIPHTVHIIISLLILVISYVFFDTAALKGLSWVRYFLYASQPENPYLRRATDYFSVIMKKVIKIKDACSSGQDQDNCSVARADGLSRRDFEGIRKNVVVGVDGELKEIYDRLLGYQPELEIVSIVGMGGIGKTALARQIYDDHHIVCHFDICAWVTVSQSYSLRHVLLGLLDSLKTSAKEIMQNYRVDDLDQKLGEHLHKSLVSRRFLIVMDDVWDTKVWDFVRMNLPDNNNGSRVLLTTRLSEVASYANSDRPSIHMQFLNHCDSWNLLHEKVFGGECCPPELETIGRTIAGNCRGLPLAIVVVGGFLCNERRTERDWTHVSRNLISILRDDDEQCMEILSLSYNHLPHHLKPCFVYMGAFNEDEEIHVTRLFNLWAAEGFLKPCKTKSLEEVAEEYLKDLIQRSLVLVGKWSCDGKIKTCKIHDLIRDVCWLNAGKENFIYFANRKPDYDGAEFWYKLSTLIEFDNGSDSRSSYVMAHSFIYTGKSIDILNIYVDFKLLRVLDIVRLDLNGFPDQFLLLVHLRYLGLNNNHRLPPSILRLWNLQTIVYYGTRFGSSLWIPVEIWSMPNLRYLYFMGDFFPDPPAFHLLQNSTVLENLQTLVGISNFRCTKAILKSIPNLKKLGISYHDSSPVECYLESLVNLHQLETLKISMKYGFSTSDPKLAFPQKIKKLALSGCRFSWESLRIVGALPNLQVLKLRNHACEGQIWEPVEGEFCQLTFLLVEDTNLEQWRANECHFPSLQRLILKRLYKLEELPCDIGEIPTLEMIELVDCHPSAVALAKQIQKEQHSMGNEYLKIHTETSVASYMN